MILDVNIVNIVSLMILDVNIVNIVSLYDIRC